MAYMIVNVNDSFDPVQVTNILLQQIRQKNVDMDFLRTIDQKIRNMAKSVMDWTDEMLRAIEPRSMMETYDFLMRVHSKLGDNEPDVVLQPQAVAPNVRERPEAGMAVRLKSIIQAFKSQKAAYENMPDGPDKDRERTRIFNDISGRTHSFLTDARQFVSDEKAYLALLDATSALLTLEERAEIDVLSTFCNEEALRINGAAVPSTSPTVPKLSSTPTPPSSAPAPSVLPPLSTKPSSSSASPKAAPAAPSSPAPAPAAKPEENPDGKKLGDVIDIVGQSPERYHGAIITPALAAVAAKARLSGVYLKAGGSRSNDISVMKKGHDEPYGEVLLMNSRWQEQLVRILEGSISGDSPERFNAREGVPRAVQWEQELRGERDALLAVNEQTAALYGRYRRFGDEVYATKTDVEQLQRNKSLTGEEKMILVNIVSALDGYNQAVRGKSDTLYVYIHKQGEAIREKASDKRKELRAQKDALHFAAHKLTELPAKELQTLLGEIGRVKDLYVAGDKEIQQLVDSKKNILWEEFNSYFGVSNSIRELTYWSILTQDAIDKTSGTIKTERSNEGFDAEYHGGVKNLMAHLDIVLAGNAIVTKGKKYDQGKKVQKVEFRMVEGDVAERMEGGLVRVDVTKESGGHTVFFGNHGEVERVSVQKNTEELGSERKDFIHAAPAAVTGAYALSMKGNILTVQPRVKIGLRDRAFVDLVERYDIQLAGTPTSMQWMQISLKNVVDELPISDAKKKEGLKTLQTGQWPEEDVRPVIRMKINGKTSYLLLSQNPAYQEFVHVASDGAVKINKVGDTDKIFTIQ